MDIGKKLKELRTKSGITQKELASSVGVATITIQRYESGEVKPNLNRLMEISDILDVPLTDLVIDTSSQEFETIKILRGVKDIIDLGLNSDILTDEERGDRENIMFSVLDYEEKRDLERTIKAYDEAIDVFIMKQHQAIRDFMQEIEEIRNKRNNTSNESNDK